MAIYEDLVSKARLKTFLDEIKKHFPVSVNGKKQDSNGNIVIPNFGGASASSNGTSGMVPAPLKGQQDKVLKGDGTWDIVSIAGGGTGQTTVAGVRNILGLGNTDGPLPIANGGTGADNAASARTNLGIDATLFNPTGSILPFAGSSIPSGYLACNGSAISRTTYSALYNVIGTKYGSGNGSTTFNLPNLEDNRFMEFHSTPATKKNAGLPNITGYIDKIRVKLNSDYATSGAFSGSVSTSSGDSSAGSANTIKFNFNASKGGSALYGASTTVQPKSLTVRAIIKY
nr:MAG TPA: tail collar fiber protein [Caudoviricetes sp.]